MLDKSVANLYGEEDLLPLSGIQHFAYCERQWALIHVENQWVENLRTAEGRLLHQMVDDPSFIESRGDIKKVRSVPLVSKTLGLFGVADLIELHRDPGEASDQAFVIVEYKRGKIKPDDRDEVQLCAQAICLEEMLEITLNYGFIYYGEIKRRHRVNLNDHLRARVRTLAEKMHSLFEAGVTPLAVKGKRCTGCSMIDVCLPKLGKRKLNAASYMAAMLEKLADE